MRRLNRTMMGAAPIGLLLVILGIADQAGRVLIVVGALITLASFFWWHRSDRRVQELHRTRDGLLDELALIRGGGEPACGPDGDLPSPSSRTETR